ncbi:unnamed protein product [Penicillium olsonii]|nr:unnamed protein product [Penicillium olsonii]CAG7930165.1 unnamed protein product [Penicillium olsonii]
MDAENPPLTIHSAEEVFEDTEDSKMVFLCTAIVAYDGETAYHGTTTARKKDLDEEAVLKTLKPIPREHICPQFNRNLTRAPEIYETLREHPHPALGRSLGCIVGEDGRVTGLVLVKYEKTLFERAFRMASFGEEEEARCIEAVEAGLQHLHSLGMAHNDLSPLNVMFTDEGEAVLIDFDACHPIGTKLIKGGAEGEWEGGLPVAVYETSSTECDHVAVQHMKKWLKKRRDDTKLEDDPAMRDAEGNENEKAKGSAQGPLVF